MNQAEAEPVPGCVTPASGPPSFHLPPGSPVPPPPIFQATALRLDTGPPVTWPLSFRPQPLQHGKGNPEKAGDANTAGAVACVQLPPAPREPRRDPAAPAPPWTGSPARGGPDPAPPAQAGLPDRQPGASVPRHPGDPVTVAARRPPTPGALRPPGPPTDGAPRSTGSPASPEPRGDA